MKAITTVVTIKKEVKYSIVYGNDRLPGLYIPKSLLPKDPPAKLKITLEESK